VTPAPPGERGAHGGLPPGSSGPPCTRRRCDAAGRERSPKPAQRASTVRAAARALRTRRRRRGRAGRSARWRWRRRTVATPPTSAEPVRESPSGAESVAPGRIEDRAQAGAAGERDRRRAEPDAEARGAEAPAEAPAVSLPPTTRSSSAAGSSSTRKPWPKLASPPTWRAARPCTRITSSAPPSGGRDRGRVELAARRSIAAGASLRASTAGSKASCALSLSRARSARRAAMSSSRGEAQSPRRGNRDGLAHHLRRDRAGVHVRVRRHVKRPADHDLAGRIASRPRVAADVRPTEPKSAPPLRTDSAHRAHRVDAAAAGGHHAPPTLVCGPLSNEPLVPSAAARFGGTTAPVESNASLAMRARTRPSRTSRARSGRCARRSCRAGGAGGDWELDRRAAADAAGGAVTRVTRAPISGGRVAKVAVVGGRRREGWAGAVRRRRCSR